jgi:hypothetical protein
MSPAFRFLLGLANAFVAAAWAAEGVLTWRIDQAREIGGHVPTVLGAPATVLDANRKVLCFDGKSDALIFGENPLHGLKAFTVEILFKPDADGSAAQRFVHFEDSSANRALIETRVTPEKFWYLDTFLYSGQREKGVTLVDKTKLYACDRWYWAALVYDGRTMSHYVNGVKQQQGAVDFGPMEKGRMSLGVRLSREFWFKGCIAELRIQPRAVDASSLRAVKNAP